MEGLNQRFWRAGRISVFGLLILAVWMSGCSHAKVRMKRDVDQEMRGVWVTTAWGLDYPAEPSVSAEELRRQADEILDGADEYGFNTVFLQVRPCSDALYRSDIYPWSKYLTGQYGAAPDSDFDPLAYWVEEAHERGLELHAWINPYQATRSENELENLADRSPAVLHPEWLIEYGGRYYFDPALPEVRQMVIDGAVELVEHYDIDGIHMDDYFYPGSEVGDAASYAAYGADFPDIGDWRRENTNLLVQGMDEAVHRADPGIEFGISPTAIWANKTMHPEGSENTTGFSSYFEIYADSKKWVESGWVDYIAPQLYWQAGDAEHDFTSLLAWWSDLVAGTDGDVELYVGLADSKAADAEADSPWYEGKEIAAQMKSCKENVQVGGTIHFRYSFIRDIPALQEILQEAWSD
mgnify:FL=1